MDSSRTTDGTANVQQRRIRRAYSADDLRHGHRKRHVEASGVTISKQLATKRGPSITETASPEPREGPFIPKTFSRMYCPPGRPRYFKSRLLSDKNSIEKPWAERPRTLREKLQSCVPTMGIFIGLCLAGFFIWTGYRSVSANLYCPVLTEDFRNGLDPRVWTKEIEVGGFGVGAFEQSTDAEANIFNKEGILTIMPTLQNSSLVERNNLIDLREQGCTSRSYYDCVAVTNTTNGTIVPPVLSGRLNTRAGATIRYGRVEVTARLPVGDWLWPSIVLLPVNNTYGPWPQSGEISIAQSRGNNYTYAQGGNDIVASCLHFGPNAELDGWWRNNVKSKAYRETFADRFHKYGVEWTEKYIFTYIDTRLLQVYYQHFDKPFWKFGEFPSADGNGTRFINTWEHGSLSTPFDQDFYLAITLHVGATNGWFEDDRSGKPWLDRDKNARQRFWLAQDEWLPTWKKPWMEVSDVKMWQLAPHRGCDKAVAERFIG